jgi:hypothetical protein
VRATSYPFVLYCSQTQKVRWPFKINIDLSRFLRGLLVGKLSINLIFKRGWNGKTKCMFCSATEVVGHLFFLFLVSKYL